MKKSFLPKNTNSKRNFSQSSVSARATSSFKIYLFSILLSFSIFPGEILALSDVSTADSYFIPVRYLETTKTLSGYPDGTFRPAQELNRAEAIKMIISIYPREIFQKDFPALNFSDVKNTDWFYKSLQKSVALKIIDDKKTSFNPSRTINRAEFIKILTKTFNLNLSKNKFSIILSDVSADDWFTPYFQFFATEKILIPDAENKVFPGKNVTRSEAAKLVFNFLKTGNGLKTKYLLQIGQEEVSNSMEKLLAGDVFEAKFILSQALLLIDNIPSNQLKNSSVQDNINLIKSLENIIASYEAIEKRQKDSTIFKAKKAWSLADKIKSNQEIPSKIKDVATNFADYARKNF
jgi:hypothetical protein